MKASEPFQGAAPAEGDVLALPFDQYQRYRLVSDILGRLRGEGPALDVLDVGGRTAVLRKFCRDARITLVDLEPSEEPGLVLGDGARLPFKDRSFDAVCAFDTLEHVPPPLRPPFVAECRRVARRWVVLAGPYDSERNAEAEELLQRFLERKLGERHRYLDEHRRHGLPDRGAVEAQLRRLGGEVAAVGHGNLERWLALQCLSMYMDYDDALRPLARDFQRFYNAELYASDHDQPVYRHVVVAAFEGAGIPELDGLLDPPRAPQGALRQVFDLGAELVHFDRERARWRSERAAFLQAVEEQRRDLEGHEKMLSELRADRDNGLRGAAALEKELADQKQGFERKVAELASDLDGHRRALAEIQAELARQADVRAGLAADLEGHRKALADSRADLEGHRAALAGERAERERLAAHAAGLEGSVASLRNELDAARADLERSRAELARMVTTTVELESALRKADDDLRRMLGIATGLENSLAERELVYDRLRSELRSRWRNLVRFFKPPA